MLSECYRALNNKKISNERNTSILISLKITFLYNWYVINLIAPNCPFFIFSYSSYKENLDEA